MKRPAHSASSAISSALMHQWWWKTRRLSPSTTITARGVESAWLNVPRTQSACTRIRIHGGGIMSSANILAVTGNQAVAQAMKQINPDVVAAYPITPQTDIVQAFRQYVADGVVKAELITVESEHSAMSACVGSAAAGARTMTATSSAGFALMFEILFVAASMRLPIVMTTVNRALSGPINIHCDHSDSMSGRDAGWIQIYNEDAQEAYDATVMGFAIAEQENVRLPLMNMYDGFIRSGAIGPLRPLDTETVQSFV